MTNVIQRPKRSAPTLIRLASVVAVAAMAVAVPTRPAFADRDDRQGEHDRGRHRGEHDHERARGRYHRYPVYVPPPVYYPREESPGIRLFFPIEIH